MPEADRVRAAADPRPANNAESDPAEVLRRYGRELADAVDQVIESWVLRCVRTRWSQFHDVELPPQLSAEATQVATVARREVGAELRSLLGSDLDAQRNGPLSVLRAAVRFPTALLRAAGVAPVVRDAFAERAFPLDVYDLSPAAFADIDPSLHEPGLHWGAAKAHAALQRRRT
ncbi:MAG: hypothetical protein ACKV2O_07570 [Acidimicrobiales bacterium]